MKTFQGYYLKKDYPNALLTLEKGQNEIEPGLWHYNLGTIHAEMKHWPLARFHFLSAEAKGFDTKELQINRAMAEEALEVERLEQPLNTSDYFIKAGLIASDGILVTLSLILLVIALFLLKQKASVKKALIFMVAILIPLILDFWIDSWPRKIAVESDSLKEGPSALFADRGELPAGVMVLTNTKGEWEEIIFPARFEGWVKSENLKRLGHK